MKLDPSDTFVLLHAHPDDETLWTGALIATAAAAGCRVVVVTCTRGERGEVLTNPGTASAGLEYLQNDPAALGAYRSQELAAALRELGPGVEHHFLDQIPVPAAARFWDSGMVWLKPGVAGADPRYVGGFAQMPVAEPAHLFAAFLASLLGSGRVVVVTYGPDGGYHHPDHVRAHDVARRALTVLNDGSSEADRPSKTFTAPEFWQVVGPDTPLPAQAEILAVPVLPVLTKIVLALQQYATQVQEVAVAPNLTCSQEQEQIDGIDSGDKAVAWFELSNAVPQPIGGWEKYLVSR